MAKRVRYVLEEGAPFSFHSEGLTVQAITRKNEVAVTVELEGLTRKRLEQLQTAIHRELARREQSWQQQRSLLHQFSNDVAPKTSHDNGRPAA